uniref:Uncharacterized protein n=1 Tax=Anguilla anguilla TaxID=7936 RepID=A0A0E9RGG9_ANGAN
MEAVYLTCPKIPDIFFHYYYWRCYCRDTKPFKAWFYNDINNNQV